MTLKVRSKRGKGIKKSGKSSLENFLGKERQNKFWIIKLWLRAEPAVIV